MMLYTISPHIVTTDPKSEVVYNKRTGERHEMSAEVLKLLDIFRSPISIDEALLRIHTEDRSESSELHSFIRDLIAASILVTEAEAQEKDAQGIISGAKVQRPCRGFLSAPIRDLDTLDNEDIVFLGSTFDLGTTGYPGARYAPDRMRELSSDAFEYHANIFTGKSRGWYSHETNRNILDKVSMADVGNVLLHVGEGFDSYFNRVCEVVRTVKERGGFPVIFGGDHSVSYATISAFQEEAMGVVHVDAHTDLGTFVQGIPNNHGNVFTRLREEKKVNHLIQLGIRSFAGEIINSTEYAVVSTKQLREQSLATTLSHLNPTRKYFLSLDVDVLDPAFAPGTGTPVPGGISPPELLNLLSALAKRVNFVGCELVEVNPMLDQNDRTSLLAIETIVHFLGEVFV